MVNGESWFENLLEVGLETFACAFLVDAAQTAVADDIGDQDGGKAAFHTRPSHKRTLFNFTGVWFLMPWQLVRAPRMMGN